MSGCVLTREHKKVWPIGVNASGARSGANEHASLRRLHGGAARLRAWRILSQALRPRWAPAPARSPGKAFGLVRMRAASRLF